MSVSQQKKLVPLVEEVIAKNGVVHSMLRKLAATLLG